MAAKSLNFLYENCVCCGICVQTCPVSCIQLTKSGIDRFNKLYPEMADSGCTSCGLCVRSCPTDAIIMLEKHD